MAWRSGKYMPAVVSLILLCIMISIGSNYDIQIVRKVEKQQRTNIQYKNRTPRTVSDNNYQDTHGNVQDNNLKEPVTQDDQSNKSQDVDSIPQPRPNSQTATGQVSENYPSPVQSSDHQMIVRAEKSSGSIEYTYKTICKKSEL